MGNYLLVKGTKNLNVIGSANVMGNLRVNGNANIHGTLNVGVRITTKNIQDYSRALTSHLTSKTDKK